MKLAKNGLVNNMDLFTYLMAKKGHNTHRDLFSYLLGKNAGGNGTYTTFSGTSLNISNTLQAKIKNIALEGNTSQDGDPTPDTPIPIKVVTGEQSINVRSKNLFNAFNLTYETVDEDGTIILRNIASVNGYHETRKSLQELCPSLKVGDVVYLYLLSDWNRKVIYSSPLGNWSNGQSRTITQAMLDSKIILYGGYNTTTHIKIMITTELDTKYIPYYTPQTYPLSLGNIELARIGNYKDYIFKNVVGSPYYNANLDLNEWYLHKEIIGENLWEKDWAYESESSTPVPRTVLRLRNMSTIHVYFSNCFLSSEMNNQQIVNRLKTDSPNWFLALANNLTGIETTDSNNIKLNKITTFLQSISANIYYRLITPTNTKITDTTLVSQLENINNNARSYKDTTIIECTSASTDNEVIGFSGDIKVSNLNLGNSLNTRLLSSNLQEETNIDDIQEEPNLDEIEDIEQNEEIEEEVS